MRIMRLLSALLAIVAAGVVASCGGGGSDAGTSPFGNGDSGGGGSASATDLVVELSKATIANTGSDSVLISVTAIDNGRNVVADAPVKVSADGDAIVSASAATTGTNGKVEARVSIGSNRSNRVITVTAVSGAISKTSTVTVFGARLTGTVVPAVLSPGAPGKIEYRLLDQAGAPMANQEITVVATGLTPASETGTTGLSGQYSFSFTAPAASGQYPVTATGGGASTDPAPIVQVQAASNVPTVTATISSASVQANPSVVGLNVGTATANRSEVRALFVGPNNLPIPNVRVKFDLDGDVNSVGGSFTSGASTLYSDANGVATTAYIAGSRSSPTDGVTVRACYGVSETDPGFLSCGPNNRATVKLTVSSDPLGVTIGTNELIIVNELTYVKKFIVAVANAAGNALPDVNLTVSVDLPNFRKGFYVQTTDGWAKVAATPTSCQNEDLNRNGVLEAGEDLDADGRLEPGKPDVTILLLHSKTRADGTAELQLQYPKSYGSWVDAKITVSASGVTGTEGRTSLLVTPVPVPAAALKNKDAEPAFVNSPYGIQDGCNVKD
jgi:hypothetical protein